MQTVKNPGEQREKGGKLINMRGFCVVSAIYKANFKNV